METPWALDEPSLKGCVSRTYVIALDVTMFVEV
jgi:hypothetical protein